MSGLLRRNFLFWLKLLLLAPLAAATLAGFAGTHAWVLDLFSHFRVQYCVAALVFVALFAALRQRGSMLIAVLLLAINLTPVIRLCWPHAPAVQAAGQTNGAAQHVLMMNVYRGNPGIQRILKYIRQENPDVVVLEEVTQAWVKPLKSLEARYPFHWVYPGTARTGIAVFSRTAPVETRLIMLGPPGKPSLLMTLELGRERDQRLSILGTHPNSPTGPSDAHERNRELAALARVAREHIWPIVIVGDLNISPFSPVFARMLREGGLRSCDGGALHATWPAWGPPFSIQIDHCLASEGVNAADFKVGPSLGSDHHAISVRISPVLKPPAEPAALGAAAGEP